MKYRHKIALIFTLICTLIIGSFSSIIYVLVNKHNQQQFHSRLEERAILAGQVLLEKDELSSGQYNKIVEKQLRKLPKEIHYILRIDENGEIPFENLPPALQAKPVILSLNEHLDIAYKTINDQEVAYLFYDDNEGTHIVVITAKDNDGDEDLAFIQSMLIVLTLLTFLITGVVAILFANKILSPVKKIIQQVQKINSSTLDERLEINEIHDQLYELSKTFNELLERLGTSFENQKQFIHHASHELKTPLTVILAQAEVLREQLFNEEEKKSIDQIHAQAEKLKHILDTLLEISFVENKNKLTIQKIRIDEVVQEAVNFCLKSSPSSAIRITYEEQVISDHYLECNGNENWLLIVVQNILSNAIKYSNNKPVGIHISETNQRVKVEIKDEGIGIPREDLEKIGNTFYRGKNSSFKSGSGVGLALSYKIINLLNGSIKIESEVEKGTTVSLSLPK